MNRILIIEPDLKLRQSILDLLQVSGFETYEAEDIHIGLELAQEHLPHLILVNYETGELRPDEVEEILASDMDTQEIPLIWLMDEGLYRLNLKDPEEIGRDVLPVPFRPEELLVKVHQYLLQSNANRHLALAASPVITNVHIPAHYYDTVTGLPSSLLLHQMLIQDTQITPPEWLVAVLVIGLDRFRHLNEALGHDQGDLLLREISQRLMHCIGAPERVFHLGEDKFAVLLPDLIQEEDAAQIAADINQEISQSLPFKEHELHMTASIGIALYPTDTREVKKLVRCAETAMFQAKEQGRNTFQFYSGVVRSRAYERLNLESGLHKALKAEEFCLYYQPKVNLRTQKVVGMEALLRWHHEGFGWVSPAQFIPLAEETDLILGIGQWVLQKACEQNQRWTEAGYDLRVSVNVSGQQFSRSNIVKVIDEALESSGLDPQYLQLELTESVLMKNISNTAFKLSELKKRGVSVAVDDFGTGYSSLAYLKRFHLDTLKIDQSFVRDIENDADDAAIVSAIVNMAHELKMSVVAEGVENPNQLAFLQDHDCDVVQGYYFARPLPPEAFEALLERDLTPLFNVESLLSDVSDDSSDSPQDTVVTLDDTLDTLE